MIRYFTNFNCKMVNHDSKLFINSNEFLMIIKLVLNSLLAINEKDMHKEILLFLIGLYSSIDNT